ncbi:AAA family ATPase [Massilia sp. BJB1822]|uniref:AAA family ATPase n=1 Tax=Massilia sp. BJB1822 TaxID=2744470 RepID=UPI001593F18A|nr:AAA family ATPase [Massilia sp. BJB1822]NVD97799.1 AAA family ATPase [Massilia sp. BJB1822]
MINSIHTKFGELQLVPSAVLQDASMNIYAADSMTLVVGPNGSGKSRSLYEIVSNVLSVNKSVEGKDNPYSKTQLVYYTPIPFPHVMPPEGEQFIDLSKRKKSVKEYQNFAVLNDIAGFFGFSPEVVFAFHPADYIQHHIAQFFSSGRWVDIKKLPEAFRQAIEDLQAKQKEAELQRKKIGYQAYRELPAYQDLLNTESEVEDRIASYLKERLGDEYGIKMLALLHTTKEHTKMNDMVQWFLQAMEVPFVRELKTLPKTAINAYRQALGKLQDIAKILDETDITTVTLLTEEQVKSLQKTGYASFGEIAIKGLSAGGAALLEQFSIIENALRERKSRQDKKFSNLLLLIDEGDVFLHLKWQQKYISFLNDYIRKIKERGRFTTIQVVLTTHSPVLMSDFPRDCIIQLSGDEQQGWAAFGAASNEEIVSFGAPLQTIIHQTGKAGTIGEFSVEFMRQIVGKLREGEAVKDYHIRMIDDPVIQSFVKRLKGTKEI